MGYFKIVCYNKKPIFTLFTGTSLVLVPLFLCYNKDTSKVYDNFSFIICVLNEVKSFKPRSYERGLFYVRIMFCLLHL